LLKVLGGYFLDSPGMAAYYTKL